MVKIFTANLALHVQLNLYDSEKQCNIIKEVKQDMASLAHLLRLLEIQFWESVQPVAQLTNEVEFHLESEEKQKKLKSV